MKRRQTLRMWMVTIHRETVGVLTDMLDRLLLVLTAMTLMILALALCWTCWLGEPLSKLPSSVLAWTSTFAPGDEPRHPHRLIP